MASAQEAEGASCCCLNKRSVTSRKSSRERPSSLQREAAKPQFLNRGFLRLDRIAIQVDPARRMVAVTAKGIHHSPLNARVPQHRFERVPERVEAFPVIVDADAAQDRHIDPSTRQMIVSEAFDFREAGSTTFEQCTTEFRMRCWSTSELQECFGPWFADVDILPDYVVPPAWADRLVLLATRKREW